MFSRFESSFIRLVPLPLSLFPLIFAWIPKEWFDPFLNSPVNEYSKEPEAETDKYFLENFAKFGQVFEATGSARKKSDSKHPLKFECYPASDPKSIFINFLC